MVGNYKLLFCHFPIPGIPSYLKSVVSWECRRQVNFYCVWLHKQNPSAVRLLWIQSLVHMIEFFGHGIAKWTYAEDYIWGKKGESNDDKICTHPSYWVCTHMYLGRTSIKCSEGLYCLCVIPKLSTKFSFQRAVPKQYMWIQFCALQCRHLHLTMTTIKSMFSFWERTAPEIIIPNLFSS